MAPMTPTERREIERRSKQREGRPRGKYPEVHGKVVASITRTIDDGALYFTVRFTDQTSFCVGYACDRFALGAELSDWGVETTASSASTESELRQIEAGRESKELPKSSNSGS